MAEKKLRLLWDLTATTQHAIAFSGMARKRNREDWLLSDFHPLLDRYDEIEVTDDIGVFAEVFG